MIDSLENKALVVLAYLPDHIAGLKLDEPVFALYSMPLPNALVELSLWLVQRLQVFKGNVVYLAGLGQERRIFLKLRITNG